MGQAFDRDGAVLGEAYGETKREVLDKLERMHPDAAEVRIKTVRDELTSAQEQIHQRAASGYAPHPSVGRSVHYVAYGTPGGEFPAGVCRAATITEVDPLFRGNPGEVDGPWDEPGEPRVGLFIANPTGCFFSQHVPYDAEKKPGSWHWPERV